jgi:hypothetical protein
MLVKQVTEVGRNWARMGLDRSRAALELGADRLRATADRLGTWSSKLSPEQPAQAQDEAQTEHVEGVGAAEVEAQRGQA